MTLPNTITLTRLLLAAAVVALLLMEGIPGRFTWAALLFILASSTDFIDGVVARRTRTTSELGTFMDPLADKLLILPTFVVLVVFSVYPLWLFVLMLIRDLLNDAYRNFAARQRIVLGANPASKLKTVLQMLSILFALLVLVFRHEQRGVLPHSSSDFLFQVANLLMLIALLIGIAGTVQFIAKHSRIITGNE